MDSQTSYSIKRFELKGAELKVGAPVWIDFDISRCTGTGWCIDVCPENVFKLKIMKSEKKIEIDINGCINCGNCVDICKPKAIVAHSYNHIQEYLTKSSKISDDLLNDIDDYLSSP